MFKKTGDSQILDIIPPAKDDKEQADIIENALEKAKDRVKEKKD